MEQEKFQGKGKIIAVVILILGVTAIGVLALLRDKIMQNNEYQFTVSAQGKVYAQPDVATVDFTIQTDVNKNIGVIVKEGNTKMTAIIAALKDLKIEAKDIQTTQYQLNPVYSYPTITYNPVSVSSLEVPDAKIISKTQTRTILEGYQLTESVTVKIRDLTVVGDAITKAIAAGANQTGGVSFTIDDQEKIKAQARAGAIAKAISKAEEISKASGLKLGKLINVQENVGPIYYANSYQMMDKAAGMAAPEASPTASIESGQMTITDDVILTYKIK